MCVCVCVCVCVRARADVEQHVLIQHLPPLFHRLQETALSVHGRECLGGEGHRIALFLSLSLKLP